MTKRRIGWITALSVCSAAAMAGAVPGPDSSKVTREDGATARLVAEIVTARHINHPRVDDDLSRRLLERFVDVWDPQKLYFLKADLDEFRASETSLDDQIRAGNVEFANAVFDRFRLRMNERVPVIEEMIETEHDYTVEEDMVVDPDDLDWCVTVADLRERWRKRIKFDLLMLKLDDTEPAEARKRLHTRYRTNRMFLEQTEGHEVLELFLSSLTHCLDPHSSYMSPQTLEDFRIVMGLSLQGIGARLRFDDGYTVVDEVIEGGSAEADGRLTKGDRIIGVDPDGPSGEHSIIDVVEMKLTKVVTFIRGEPGTQVQLQVKKESGVVEDYVLTRATVKLTEQEVKGKIIDSGTWVDGQTARIGVLNIPSFYRDFEGASRGGEFKSTSRDVKQILKEFNRANVDAVIVDLRWNGGGALEEATEVSGLFIPDGPIVQVRAPQNAVDMHIDPDPEMYWRKPVVVLCNRFSASASEIFAGAMKDYRRAIIVGDTTTHGKGTVQNVMNVASRLSLFGRDRGAIKLTISKFYRVNGDSTQNRGVTSDIVLPSLLSHRDIGEDSLDNALAFDRIQRADYSPFLVYRDDAMLEQLAAASSRRIAEDSDFRKVNRAIERYLERKNRKTISLNEAQLRQEQEELKREQEEEEEAIRKAGGNDDTKDIFPGDDFYNREVMNITLEYLNLVRNMRTASR